jgi:hypothetical protein
MKIAGNKKACEIDRDRKREKEREARQRDGK